MNYNYPSSLPPQKVSLSTKLEEKWQRDSVFAIDNMASGGGINGRTTQSNKQENYDLVNSKFHESSFSYVLDPYGTRKTLGDTPAHLQNYNIIRPQLELLKGEEMRRPSKFMVIGVGGEVLSAKIKFRKQLIMELMQNMIAQAKGQQVEGVASPDQLQLYSSKYADPIEINVNRMLQDLMHSEMIEMKLNQGWEHGLVSSEECYYVGLRRGRPAIRVVNSLNLEFSKDSSSPFIEDSQWVREERWLTPGTIIDELGDKLTEDELKKIDDGYITGVFNKGMQLGYIYDPWSYYEYNHKSSSDTTGLIRVAHVCWKSMRKIGFLTYLDPETNQIVEKLIPDDDFKLSKELKDAGAILEWEWISEVWEGTRIGDDIVCDVRPSYYQPFSDNNIGICKLPYVGFIYGNVNTMATSLVDLIKPHQYTYMIVWWRMENEIAKAKGKKFIMDMAMLPRSQGWTVEQWMHYFDNMGIAWINTLEEGRKNLTGQPASSSFNQFREYDMTLSQTISQYMEVLKFIEEKVDNIVGISPQRRAQVAASETATGTNAAMVQSSYITEPLFYFHNLVKQNVLTQLLDLAKYAYADGYKKDILVDDFYTQFINLERDALLGTDWSLYVTNSSKDQEAKMLLQRWIDVAIQQEKVAFSDVIKFVKSNSMSELASQLEKSEQEFYQRQQQQIEAQQQSAERIQEMQVSLEREKLAKEYYKIDSDNATKIQVATISALKGVDGPSDMDGDGIPDPVEMAKLSLEQQKMLSEHQAKQTELVMKEREAEQDRQLKKFEIAFKKEEAQMKKEQFQREQDQQDKENTRQDRTANEKIKADKQKSQIDKQKEEEKAKVERDKLVHDKAMQEKELALEKKMHEDEMKLEREKIRAEKEIQEAKIREIKEKMKLEQQKINADIQATKAKTAADIEIKKQQATIQQDVALQKGAIDVEFHKKDKEQSLKLKKKAATDPNNTTKSSNK